MLRNSLLAFAALGLAGCATNPGVTETADRDCFPVSSVSGYEVIDDYHVLINVSPNRDYIMTTLFNASELDWTQQVALRSNTSFVCTGNGLGVEIIGGDRLPRNYPIQSITRAPEPAPAQG